MRRLQHVAAGVEDEVGLGEHVLLRGGPRVCGRARRALAEPLQLAAGELAEPLQVAGGELETRQHGDVALQLADGLGTGAPALQQFLVRALHRDPGHREEEARIDAIVASAHTVAAQHARLRPEARRLGPAAAPQDVDHAANHRLRRGVFDPGRLHARADLDAFATARAGISHLLDALGQGRLETDLLHRAPALHLRSRESRPIQRASQRMRCDQGPRRTARAS
jgi:hypothetical protein